MNGAESLARTLAGNDVWVCFANPGTSEMHFVAALDRVHEIRCVLGLFEGVVTGAADGFYRLSGTPAATLLHLGPGLANGLANLHNARKARSGIVNVVGEHASYHIALDAPLTSDIEGLARPMSDWVRTTRASADVATDGAAAIAAAREPPGKIATLILPADAAWGPGSAVAHAPSPAARNSVSQDAIKQAAQALRSAGSSALLLGGAGLREPSTKLAGRIAAVTGCALLCENLNARLERGAGRVQLTRIPYPVDAALKTLDRYRQIVLVGARAPIAFFAYPERRSRLTHPDAEIVTLAEGGDDIEAALDALCAELGASSVAPSGIAQLARPEPPDGTPEPDKIGRVIGALLPENAIVIDEAITAGRSFGPSTASAPPHDWLNSMGGSIGFGLPVAIGAAIACPSRKVLALEGDGSAMYTLQALWTMAREQLDVTVVIFANRAYRILQGELANVGAGNPGRRALDMMSLDRPNLDWLALAKGHGIEAGRATDLSEFARELRRGFSSAGPYLIELVM